MAQNIIQSLKGTRDFYPEEMTIHLWLKNILTDVSESFGYQPYEGPYLEKLELYAAKSGEELVKEQAFCFEDRGGEFITLRPELTPTLARMVAQKQRQLNQPLRWYSFGPFWRYERPQRGRTREFFQWNIDLLGVDSPDADAEMVSICAAFFKKINLNSDVAKIKINHRGLMDDQFDKIGITVDQKKGVLRLIDRRDKMKPDAWVKFASDLGLNQAQISGLLAILENKDLWKESDSLSRLFMVLEATGWSEYVEYDPGIIRGLEYYTGTVFEAVDVRGGRAILGGGHYDNLVGDVGGEPMPGVGFAMGDVMISIILGDYGLIPDLSSMDDTVMVTIFDEPHALESYRFAQKLRAGGIKTSVYPEPVKLMKQFKYADRLGIGIALVIGPDEIAAKQVSIKNLKTREQYTIAEEKVLEELGKILA
jgi:histidyl-tRNA synthetase